jgi:hypothetical protein
MTLRNSGAAEAQFPLPIGHNFSRVLFERDVPVLVPFFYRKSLSYASLPRFEQARATQVGRVQSTDDVMMVPVGYQADVIEIPMEYQTLEGIEKFEQMLSDVATAPPGFDMCVGARIGPKETSPHSMEWDKAVKKTEADKKLPPAQVKK